MIRPTEPQYSKSDGKRATSVKGVSGRGVTTAVSVCCSTGVRRQAGRYATATDSRVRVHQGPARTAGFRRRPQTERLTKAPTVAGYAYGEGRAGGAAPTRDTCRTNSTSRKPSACEAVAAPKGTTATQPTGTARPIRSATARPN